MVNIRHIKSWNSADIFHLLFLRNVSENERPEFADVIEECSSSAAAQQGLSGSSETWGSVAAITNVGAIVAKASCSGWQTGLPDKLECSRDELFRRRMPWAYSPSNSSCSWIGEEWIDDWDCCRGIASSLCNLIVLDGCSFIRRVSLALLATRPGTTWLSQFNGTGRLFDCVVSLPLPDGSIFEILSACSVPATFQCL